MRMIEPIIIENKKIALIVRNNYRTEKTSFITDDEDQLQMGFIVYPEGSSITPHIHNNIERKIEGTPEVLVVQKGKMKTIFYNNNKERKGEVILEEGDVILLLDGGHGFEMLEDTVLMEIKQGPYNLIKDKVKFDSTKEKIRLKK